MMDLHPPSSNTIWKKGRGGKGFYLSKEARTFKEAFKRAVAQQVHPSQFSELLDHEGTYFLEIILLYTSLKTKTTGRYKLIDVTNRVKFLEDCLAEALDINDARNQGAFVWKDESSDAPKVILRYWPLRVEDEALKQDRARLLVSRAGS